MGSEQILYSKLYTSFYIIDLRLMMEVDGPTTQIN